MEPKTTIDWFRVRTKAEVLEALEALRPMFGPELGPLLRLDHQKHGLLGYQRGARLDVGGMVVGRMDWGGESQRGWVRIDIPGQGCGWVKDWDTVEGVESLPGAEIKRLDVALTTWEGQVGHDHVTGSHAAGGFNCGGRTPNLEVRTNSEAHRGRTCYVGKREKSDKFFRGYEKGFEMGAKFPSMPSAIDGHPIEDIYRCEVEFKAETRPIPWECIERRDQYFAGAYPFLGQLLPDVECDILLRRPERAPQLELKARLATMRHQFGKVLYTALHAYRGDIGAVWDEIVGSEHQPDLLAAGVLLVEHD